MKTLEFIIEMASIKKQPTNMPVEYIMEMLQQPVEP